MMLYKQETQVEGDARERPSTTWASTILGTIQEKFAIGKICHYNLRHEDNEFQF